MSENPKPDPEVKLGEFPFPLSDGSRESPYLTWLRNHSNYMAARGFLDYLRSVAVLVRGVLVNFLIFLPYLLLISIVLGWRYHWMLDHPFLLTRWVLAVAGLWILVFVGGIPLFKILRYKQSLKTGAECSIGCRNWYERSFGFCLLAIFVVAVLEALPWAAEFLHELVHKKDDTYSWTGMLATLGGGLVVLSSSEKLLSVFSGVKKKIVTGLMGLLGILVPLLVILYATEFLVYGRPPSPFLMFSPLIVAIIGFVLMIIGVGLGVSQRAFTPGEGLRAGAYLGLGLVVVFGVVGVITFFQGENLKKYERIENIIEPVQRMAVEFAKITNREEMASDLVESLEEIAIVQRDYEIMQKEVESETAKFRLRHMELMERVKDGKASRRSEWLINKQTAKSMGKYFKSGREYISVADDLSDLPRGRLEPLRREIVRLAYARLLELVEDRKEAELKHSSSILKPGEIEKMLQDKIVETILEEKKSILDEEQTILAEPESGGYSLPEPAPAADPRGLADKLSDYARGEARARFKELNVPIEELSRMVPVPDLERRITEKVKSLDAKRELADLTGRESLAKLLRKDELIGLMFPDVTDDKARYEEARVRYKTMARKRCVRAFLQEMRKGISVTDYAGKLVDVIQATESDSRAMNSDSLFGKLYPELASISKDRQISQLEKEISESEKKLSAPEEQKTEPEEEKTKAAEQKTEPDEEKTKTEEPKTEPERQILKLEEEKLELEEQISKLETQVNPENKLNELKGKRKSLEEQISELKEVDPKAKSKADLEQKRNELRELKRNEPRELKRKQAGLSELNEKITEVAKEELAKIALQDFEVAQLGLLARYGAHFYNSKPDENQLRKELEKLKSFNWREMEELRVLAKSAERHEIKDLVELGFQDEEAPKEDGLERTKNTLPNVNKVLLAEKLLGKQFGELVREKLVKIALGYESDEFSSEAALRELARISSSDFTADELARISVLEFADETPALEVDGNPGAGGGAAGGSSSTFPSIAADKLVTTLMFGEYGPLERDVLARVQGDLTRAVFKEKVVFISLLAFLIILLCWLAVDVNLTSVHGLYRDRLASAFLIGVDTKGDVGIEDDLDLNEICRYEARSIAPYHLINAALNLQGSKDPNIRDRNSDFFVFSKRYIGGERTGYCRSETMEDVFPQMSLATAMAISAAAASPNMGRGTNGLMVAFMTLLNIRLGYWLPHPGLLEEQRNRLEWKRKRKDLKAGRERPGFKFTKVFEDELHDIERRWRQVYPGGSPRKLADKKKPPSIGHRLVGIAFSGGGIRSATLNLGIAQALHKHGVIRHVDYMSTVSGGGYLGASLSALMRSREQLRSGIAGEVTVERLRSEISGKVKVRTDEDGDQIVEISGKKIKREYRFSRFTKLAVENGKTVGKGDLLIKPSAGKTGGTVSGAGGKSKPRKVVEECIGDQIVTITPSGEDGEANQERYWFTEDALLDVKEQKSVRIDEPLLKPRNTEGVCDIAGSVSVDSTGEDVIIVKVQSLQNDEQKRPYPFSKFEQLVVETGKMVEKGSQLIERQNTLGKRFKWRVRPLAFLREMGSLLNERSRWVNLSDGGHIENLATIELLRRRCKFIIIGDGEADPKLHFKGLATLIRTASIDFGINIDIDLSKLRLGRGEDSDESVSKEHWAIGRITYPKDGATEEEHGLLLYLKSSFTGDESEVIQEYRRKNPAFPHQSTADQMFDEGQFEAYRALGQHIAEQALKGLTPKKSDSPEISFGELEDWFGSLAEPLAVNESQPETEKKPKKNAKKTTVRNRASEEGDQSPPS